MTTDPWSVLATTPTTTAPSAPAAPQDPWASLAAAPAAASAGPAPSDKPSISGFLGNVVGGVEGLATGLGQLLGSGIHDFAKVATFGQFDKSGGFQLDNVVKSAPAAIWQDEKARWGPLFKGDFGEFAHQLYSKPVSFGLDALTVASAGATAEGMLGKAAIKGADAAAVAAGDVGSLTASTAALAKSLVESGIVPKTARAVATRTTLEDLAAAGADTGLAGTLKNLLPTTKYVREGDILKATAETYNPLTRFVKANTLERVTTTPLESLQTALADTKALPPGGAFSPAQGNKIGNLETLYNDAASKGLTRLETQRVGDIRASSAGKAINKFTSGAFFKDRLKATREDTTAWVQAAKDSTPQEAQALAPLAMGNDIQVLGLPIDPKIQLRQTEALGVEQLHPIELNPAVVAPLKSALDPTTLATNAGRPELAAAQSVLDGLDQLANDLNGKRAAWDQVSPGWVDQQLTDAALLRHDIVHGQDILASPVGVPGTAVAARTAPLRLPQTLSTQDALAAVDPFHVFQTPGRITGADLAWPTTPESAMAGQYIGTGGSAEAFGQRLKAEGIQQPAIMSYDPKTGQYFMSEGTHRALAAEAAGITDVPVTWEANPQAVAARLKDTSALAAAGRDAAHPLPVLPGDSLGAGVRPWNHAIETARLRDVTRLMEGWKTFDPSSMPSAIVGEAWRPVQWMHGAETVVGGTPAELAAKATTKVEEYVRRKSEALFNAQTFDAPLSIQDAQAAVQKALDEGTNVPKTIQKAVADAKRYSYDGPGNGSSILTGPGHEQLHAAFRTADRQSPIYYPFIEADHVSSKGWFLSRQARGAVQFAQDPHNKFNAGVLYKSGDYLSNPAEAYARRAAAGVRASGTARMINAYLDRNARPITSESQLASGEVVMAPMLVNVHRDITNAFRNTSEDLQLAGMSLKDATAEALNRVHADGLHNVATQLENGGIKMYAVPEAMAKHMNDAAKWAGLVPRIGKLYVDGPMNVWRSLVLAGSPRWIVNNVLGNSLFTAMEGGSLTRAMYLMEQTAAKALNEKYGWKLNTATIDAVDKFLTEHGMFESVAGSTHAASIPSTTHIPVGSEQGLAGRIITHSREAPGKFLKPFQSFSSHMRDFNSGIEGAYRRNSFLTEFDKAAGISASKRVMRRYTMSGDGIQKLLKDGLTPGSTKAVLDGVNHFFGDFANLGPLERNIIRPYIAPFWGFYKFQTKLFLSYPFEYPARAQILAGLAKAEQDLSAGYGPLPDWLRGGVPAGPPGSNEWITSSGPNPFNGLFQSPLGQLSPLIKSPIEHFTGRSLFTGRNYTDANTVTPYGSDQQFHVVRDAQGNPIDVTPISKVTPGFLTTLLSQIPQYQEIKQTLAGGTTYDTAGLIDAIRGDAVVPDPATGLPKYPTTAGDQLMKYLGVPITNYNVTSYQDFLASQKKAALAEALKRAGVAAP